MKLKLLSLLGLLVIMVSGCGKSEPVFMPLEAPELADVRIADEFWAPRLQVNHIVGIKHALEQCKIHGNLGNFARAAGLEPGEHRGSPAYDSDVYKVIEGASYSLMLSPDPELEAYLDGLIDTIAAAQREDGYLNTYFTLTQPEARWTNLRREHELYCAGHLFEAAVAYAEATGKDKLLNVAVKLADHIDSLFGSGKRYDVPGHEEIELALIKLSKATGETRYFDLAKFFVDERGYAHGDSRKPFIQTPEHQETFDRRPENSEERRRRVMIRNGRMQDHKPILEQTEAVGHAVRAGYLYSAVADIAALTGDPPYGQTVDRLWEDVIGSKIYVTGGIGTAQYFDEGFGDPYVLPNAGSYSETCAQAAFILWNFRMNLLHGDAKYMDALELTLYNAFLSGVSLSGDRFFYSNAMSSDGTKERRDWFDPACCPSNVVRLLPQIGRFAYALGPKEVFVNLFIGGTARLPLENNSILLTQETEYPWEGKIRISVDPGVAEDFTVKLRIPGWCGEGPLAGDIYLFMDDPVDIGLKVNGEAVSRVDPVDGYVPLHRTWTKGDVIELDLPMAVRRLHAHPAILDARGCVALMRGPIVFCLEETDNADFFARSEVFLEEKKLFKSEFNKDLLGGVVILQGSAVRDVKGVDPEVFEVTAVPYFSWNNRGPGRMTVWIPGDIARYSRGS